MSRGQEKSHLKGSSPASRGSVLRPGGVGQKNLCAGGPRTHPLQPAPSNASESPSQQKCALWLRCLLPSLLRSWSCYSPLSDPRVGRPLERRRNTTAAPRLPVTTLTHARGLCFVFGGGCTQLTKEKQKSPVSKHKLRMASSSAAPVSQTHNCRTVHGSADHTLAILPNTQASPHPSQHETCQALPERIYPLFTSHALGEITLCRLKIDKLK